MTETKTKIREVIVDIRRYFSSTGRKLPRKCACCSADSSAYIAYCMIASNSVFSNIVSRHSIKNGVEND